MTRPGTAMRTKRIRRAARVGRATLGALGLWLGVAAVAEAQQRPLVTEDPEVIGGGRILVEAGVDVQRDVFFPASGLRGNLTVGPTIGVSIGLGSIVELQVDGSVQRLDIQSRQAAPFTDLVAGLGSTATGAGDVVVGSKIRFSGETEGHPAVALRLATKLPTASIDRGLGLDTMDFHAAVLVGKTVRSVRVVGNVGIGVLGNPIEATEQATAITVGGSLARALTNALEVVGEVQAKVNTESVPAPGTENRGVMRIGGRYTRGPVRVDAAFVTGFTTRDPSWGATIGATYVFDAFTVP